MYIICPTQEKAILSPLKDSKSNMLIQPLISFIEIIIIVFSEH